MKRLLIFLSFLLIFLTPYKLNAEVIVSSVMLTGNTEAKIGEQVVLELRVKTVGLEKGLEKNQGIYMVVSDLIYNGSDLAVGIPSSDNFNSIIASVEGKNGIIGTVQEGASSEHCGNGELYCGDYVVRIPFTVKNTDSTSTNVKISEVGVMLVNTETEETIELEKAVSVSKKINIKKEVTTVEVPTEKKSNNTYLRDLEIYNYKINFDKDVREYEIEVSKEVNKIEVHPIIDHPNASYHITGDTDLSANGYKVIIEVTAEDGTTANYTINVKQKENNEIADPIEKDEEKEKVNITSSKKVMKLMVGILSLLFLIIILIIISSIRKKRAINKMFDEL